MTKILLCIIATSLLFLACGQDSSRNASNQHLLLTEADSATLAMESALAAIRDTTSIDSSYYTRTGLASYYADRFHGRKTANGERYDTAAFTAAHRTLPFGTQVAVTNPANKRTVIVRVNDRGPHHKNRIIDLSKAAAKALGIYNKGVAKVKIEARVKRKGKTNNR